MKRIKVRALLLAFAITTILTGILIYYLNMKSLNIGDLEKVIVAKTNIKEKTLITEEQITEMEIPKKFIVGGSIRRQEQVVGKISRENIYAGEQIIQNKLTQGKESDGLSVVLPEGYRAITIKIDAVIGVGGHIKNGDFVDILVFLKPPINEKENIKTVFQNVRVLDVDNNNKEVLTLCMKPEEVEELFLMEELGKIRIVLRSSLDSKKLVLPGIDIESIQ